jgi:hypothetical protein
VLTVGSSLYVDGNVSHICQSVGYTRWLITSSAFAQTVHVFVCVCGLSILFMHAGSWRCSLLVAAGVVDGGMGGLVYRVGGDVRTEDIVPLWIKQVIGCI